MPALKTILTTGRFAMILSVTGAVSIGLASCSYLPASTPSEEPLPRGSSGGSLISGDGKSGVNLSDLFNGSSTGGGALPVNALLWRASLDTVSVLPLSSVDTFGGTIITEWYAHPDMPSQRIKLNIFIVDQELRADSVRVQAHVQERPEGAVDWTDLGRDDDLAVRLEDLILTRAREIRASSVSQSN